MKGLKTNDSPSEHPTDGLPKKRPRSKGSSKQSVKMKVVNPNLRRKAHKLSVRIHVPVSKFNFHLRGLKWKLPTAGENASEVTRGWKKTARGLKLDSWAPSWTFLNLDPDRTYHLPRYGHPVALESLRPPRGLLIHYLFLFKTSPSFNPIIYLQTLIVSFLQNDLMKSSRGTWKHCRHFPLMKMTR